MDIAVFGAGGFGREVALLIDQINASEKKFNFIGYFDDGVEKGTVVNGYEVLGNTSDLNNYPNELAIALAIGDCRIKEIVRSKITNSKVSFPSLVHPNSKLPEGVANTLGDGCIICNGCIITVNVTIRDFVILNLQCTVGHDAEIGDFCSLMPAVNVSGEVTIGSSVFIGTGAKIINLTAIGSNSIIGAGAVVSKDIPANCTAVGIPAKPIKFHD